MPKNCPKKEKLREMTVMIFELSELSTGLPHCMKLLRIYLSMLSASISKVKMEK